MENVIKVQVDGEHTYEVAQGTPVLELLQMHRQQQEIPVVAASINNILKDLRTQLLSLIHI